MNCGAALISDRYVLTAAHCIIDNANETLESVVLCEWNIDNYVFDCVRRRGEKKIIISNNIIIGVSKSIKHPLYDNTTLLNDIALLRLTHKVEFSDAVMPICLPNNLNLMKNFTTAGWGSRGTVVYNSTNKNMTDQRSRYLLKVNVPLVNFSVCAETWKDVYENSQICAGGKENEDTCDGDSGGPLMQLNDDGRWSLVGITSFGWAESGVSYCGTKDLPSVYSKVYSFKKWIIENMEP